jgi:hypothetical protein
MAYDNTQYEMSVASLDLTSTGDKAEFNFGYVPHIIRAAAVILNAAPGDAGVVKFDKRVTYESDTGRGDGDVAVINMLTTHSAGQVIYKNNLAVEIKPGEQVVAEVTDASASVTAATVVLFVEPAWETPANRTIMVETT